MYKQLIDSEYTEFRKKLLQSAKQENNRETQREFLERLKDSKGFCAWVREEVSSTQGDEIALWPTKLTEHEFKDPPPDTEMELYDAWNAFTPNVTCRPTFWGEVTLRHIEEGRIEASYLAANGGSLPGGAERISRLLNSGDIDGYDACVRTAIRRLSGLPERGNRSVFVNCPFSRSWWRMRLCKEVCQNTSAEESQVLDILRISQEYWERLVSLVVSRNSVFGDRNARDVLVCVLTEMYKQNSDDDVFKGTGLVKLCRSLSVRAAWMEFGVLEQDEMKSVINVEIDAYRKSS